VARARGLARAEVYDRLHDLKPDAADKDGADD
jgi:hypothetical protein